MALEQSYDIPLHDIKPIVDVEEYSLYYLLGGGVVSLVLIVGAAYLIYKWLKQRDAFSIRKEHYKLLKSLDLSDTKSSAYAITSYGFTFKNDSLRHKEIYENIVDRLEAYKYKKEVDKFDSQTISYIELYREMIDA